MKRIELNEAILSSIPYFDKFKKIVLLDTETTKALKNTKYGIQWFDQCLTKQIGVLTRNKDNTKWIMQKYVLFNTENIITVMDRLSKEDETTLVVGYNLSYDLQVIYRNIYMFKHSMEDYEAVPAFRFKVLDLMICYDLILGSVFGKREADANTHKGAADFLITNIPLRQFEDTDTISYVYSKIEEQILSMTGKYIELKCMYKKCTREVELRKEKMGGLSKDIECLYADVSTIKEKLSKHKNINTDTEYSQESMDEETRASYTKELEEKSAKLQELELERKELGKAVSGKNAKYFSSLGISCRIRKKLKDLISIITPNQEILKLEDTVGWMNVEIKDKFNYIPKEEEVKGIEVAMENNMAIVREAIECRKRGMSNDYLRYIEYDIDFLLILLHALNFPEPDFFQDEVLSQARVHYLGLKLDTDVLKNIDVSATTTIEDDVKAVYKKEVNLRSPVQMRKFLSDVIGFEATAANKRYIASLLEDELVPAKYVNVLKKICGYGSKAFSERIINSLISCGASNAHPTVYLNSTITNRGTCFGSVNWVGIPKDESIRKSFIDVISGDQSAAEVACLAAAIDDKFWITLLCCGVDTHALVLACKKGMKYEDVIMELAKEKKLENKPFTKERGECKGILFGIFYGGTDEGLAKEKKMTTEAVKEIRTLLVTLFPKFGEYLELTKAFRNFDTMVENNDWNSIGSYVGELPVALDSMFDLPAYALMSKIFQISTVNVMRSIESKLNGIFNNDVVCRDKRYGKIQTIGSSVLSALLGSIGRVQGDVQKRMQDVIIQSSVSIITKMAKSFIYRNFFVGTQDIHDEILIRNESTLDKEELKRRFSIFENWVQQFIPAFKWTLDIETGHWTK